MNSGDQTSSTESCESYHTPLITILFNSPAIDEVLKNLSHLTDQIFATKFPAAYLFGQISYESQ